MNDMMKIVKWIEESALLIKGIRETIESEAKEQKGRFLSMLFGTLGTSLLSNLLTGEGTIRAVVGISKTSESTIRVGHDF